MIATVAVYSLILLNGLLFGTGGIFRPLADRQPRADRRSVGERESERERLGERLAVRLAVGVARPPAVGVAVREPVRRARPRPRPSRPGRGAGGYSLSMGADDDRRRMVKDQLRDRGIRDERVLAAMAAVPRELFVDRDRRSRAYADEAVPIEAGQTISQP